MTVTVIVRKDTYRDSVILMRLSNTIVELDGVLQAGVVMATPTNKKFLRDLNLLNENAENAGPNDLVIALETTNEKIMTKSLSEVDRLLTTRVLKDDSKIVPKTLDSALREIPDANLVVISVPGRFAKREALKSLKKGLNVFLFSSNVSLEDELELKQIAVEKGLLIMGPDCGTAIVNNVVLGFGNVVNQGNIGLVAAAGTGLQQVSTLIHNEGYGISQAIGTGGNDLSKTVGGVMMIEGIKRLEHDDETKVIVLISKLPDQEICEKVLKIVRHSNKPVVVNFIGGDFKNIKGQNYIVSTTLEDAATAACALVQGKQSNIRLFTASRDEILSTTQSEWSRMSSNQKFVRGLYTGGTLSYEALVLLTPLLGDMFSNSPLNHHLKLEDSAKSKNHTCVDMGAEEFVIGRLHPMIDYTLRNQRIVKEGNDPETAVILLDVVLGYGSHDNPANELISPIQELQANTKRNGRYLPVIASIVGTDLDYQDLDKQKKLLEDLGVIIMPTNAQAARLAALIATRGTIQDKLFEEVF
ncbi:MAG TPA: acyl-CoA synthetase FdrA [bacterium]|nr:MAG: Succinyl-CoA ligase [ADP-forming] subunit alpha [Candidatus Heimdallarchaeota archaeon LC_3]HEC65832.1 acyl-CoA synthetase FdrA [bacterium]